MEKFYRKKLASNPFTLAALLGFKFTTMNGLQFTVLLAMFISLPFFSLLSDLDFHGKTKEFVKKFSFVMAFDLSLLALAHYSTVSLKFAVIAALASFAAIVFLSLFIIDLATQAKSINTESIIDFGVLLLEKTGLNKHPLEPNELADFDVVVYLVCVFLFFLF